jgi:ribonuclease Z
LEITIIGSGSALPVPGRNPSSIYFKDEGLTALFDCGEGTQHRLHEFAVKLMKIKYIFISHLHGDHFFGLPGLIATLDLYGRTKPLHIIGPMGVKEIILRMFDLQGSQLRYEVHFKELQFPNAGELELEYPYNLHYFPLNHSVSTFGYLLSKEIRSKEAETILNRSRKVFAYVTDTSTDGVDYAIINNVEMLYHEATYLSSEKENALKTYHSTAQDAGHVAEQISAKMLIIGHFSARYRHLQEHLTEVRNVFPNAQVAIEGQKFIW